MKNILSYSLIGLLIACATNQEESKEMTVSLKYPNTQKGEIIDTYFGVEVADPYRWLEDDMSEETEEWVKAQNNVTFDYLNQIPYRNKIKNRLEKLWNYTRYSAPFKEGNYTYYYKNDGLQNQSVIYRQKEGNEAEVFLDPNTFSKDGTTSLGGLSFSRDGSIVAYSISEGGSDWRKVIIMETGSKEIIEDTLIDVKFSGISWFKNEGFYYSSYDKPEGSELSAMTDQHKLYYHKLGTKQTEDQVIFGEDLKRRYVGGYVTEDDKYLVITASVSTTGNELYITDLSNGKRVTVLDNTDSDSDVIESYNGKLYIITNLDAPNKRLVSVDASNPVVENWIDVIPETKNVLSVGTAGGYIFAKYMVDAISQVMQYDMEGNLIRDIELPGVGTVGGFGGKMDEMELYFYFTNYTSPSAIYKYNTDEGTYDLYKASELNFDSDSYESKQVFYSSKDGTKIPMIISYKKGLELNGKNPTIIYGYGGFNIPLTPSFSVSNAVWMEMGGVYAVCNLRGGGEYGKAWHTAGTKMQKQNVFDDFIAGAEFLISEGYTSSEYLACRGGSNGGLLVGAVSTQRPDLFQVALPAVGVLDMLRYHTFTAGAGWAYDYGTAEESKEMFEYLKNYSPIHNVKEGVSYPATLVTTGDHDDRVVPAHSFKYAAELQAKNAGNNPMLIRIETNAGHGAGTPISKTIEQYSDIFGFTLFSMGIKDVNI